MILCRRISHMVEGDGDRGLVHMVLDENGQTLGQLGDVAVAKAAEIELDGRMVTLTAEAGVSYPEYRGRGSSSHSP